MPIILDLLDLNKEFEQMDKNETIIINDLPNRTEEDRAYFSYLIKETHDDSMVSVQPSCRCGSLKGEHLVKTDEICYLCKSPVRRKIQDKIKPMLWFRRPKATRQLISPYVWTLLRRRFNKRGVDVMLWLTDTSYRPQVNSPIIDRMILDNVPRGYNNFVEHFFEIFQYLINLPDFKPSKALHKTSSAMAEISEDTEIFDRFIQDHRDRIFTDYLPLMNRMLMIVEVENSTDRYLERHVADMQNVMNTMLSIDEDHFDKSTASIERRTARILHMLSIHYEEYIRTNLQPKETLCRKDVYGRRTNLSFRAVITSHDTPQRYDTIHAPWSAMVATYRLHIMNYLLRRDHPLGGMTHIQADRFINDHIHVHHPVIAEIFKLLIHRNGKGHIPCIFNRNPTLPRGSIQCLKITKVKDNPADTTVSLSDQICTAPNA